MDVGDIVHLSPLRLVTVSPDLSISQAARRLSKFDVGIAVVMDDHDDLVGVLSERDIVSGLGDREGGIDQTVVDDLMTDSVVTISSKASLVDAVFAMNANSIRHLIVADGDKPTGVISIRDILRVIALQLLDNGDDADAQLKTEIVEALAAA